MSSPTDPAVVLPGGEPVPDGPGDASSENPVAAVAPASRRSVRLVVVAAVTLAVLAVASLISLPYAVVSPGPAVNVLGTVPLNGEDVPVLAVPEGKGYPTIGQLDLTTVRISGGPGYRVTIFDVVYGWLSPQREVFDVDQLFPPAATAEQVQQEGAAEMRDSQGEAAAVAERALGLTVPERLAIVGFAPGSKAKDFLAVGDVLLSVGGVAVTTGDQVRTELQKVAAGSTAKVEVERKGAQQTFEVPAYANQGRIVLGISLGITQDLPVPVTFNAGSIGGPSAGLMFALSVYDKLTPGALTGGAFIAGTGTIDAAGRVGPIGGIRQKMYGAQESGSPWFLAPADNCPDVVDHVPDGLRVVKVSTFADGLAAVKAIASGTGSTLPTCG